MSDFIPPSLEEVWDWKRRDEAATANLNREQLIDFYRRGANEVEKKLNLSLPSVPAAEANRRMPSSHT